MVSTIACVLFLVGCATPPAPRSEITRESFGRRLGVEKPLGVGLRVHADRALQHWTGKIKSCFLATDLLTPARGKRLMKQTGTSAATGNAFFAVLIGFLSCFPSLDSYGVNFPLRWRWSNPRPHGNNVVDMAYSPLMGLGVLGHQRGQSLPRPGRNLARQTLPRIPGTFDELDGFHAAGRY